MPEGQCETYSIGHQWGDQSLCLGRDRENKEDGEQRGNKGIYHWGWPEKAGQWDGSHHGSETEASEILWWIYKV